MGFFDHLFKSKSPRNAEAPVETGPEPARSAGASPQKAPPHRADPSSFLHPKSHVPRGGAPLTPMGKPGPAPAMRKPGTPPAPAPAAVDEIVLTLGDVLSRIPSHYLKSGSHDPRRELRFGINDLSSDISRGRAAVPLSRIAQLLPDIFVQPIGPEEDSEVRLPLQKLVEQIGLLRSRPAGGATERLPRPVIAPSIVENAHQLSGHEMMPEPFAETAPVVGPARESLRDLQPIFEAPPFDETADADWDPASRLAPVSSRPSGADGVDEPRGADGPSPDTEAARLWTPAPEAETPSTESADFADDASAVVSAQESTEPEKDGEQIQLSLAAILRDCPSEIVIEELPSVPDNVRISLPFAPIDRQLVMGQVEVSAARFVAALPPIYQKFFSARTGVKVPIPLEEVFQNLPVTATEPPAPRPRIIPPATPGVPLADAQIGPVSTATAAELSPLESTPASSMPASSMPLDLPAFQQFMPPPPQVAAPASSEAAAAIPSERPDAGFSAEVSLAESPTEHQVAQSEPPAHAQTAEPAANPDDAVKPPLASEVIPPPLPMDASNDPERETSASGDEVSAVPPERPITSEAAPLGQPPQGLLPIPDLADTPPGKVGGDILERESNVAAIAAPWGSNSASVFEQPNQTIQAPRIVRPFIVLPPPILASFLATTEKEVESLEGSQNVTKEEIAIQFTDIKEQEMSFVETADEVVGNAAPNEIPIPESVEIEREQTTPEPSENVAPPSIISIDFSQALVAPEDPLPDRATALVEISEIPPPNPTTTSAEEPNDKFTPAAEALAPEPIDVPGMPQPAADKAPDSSEAPVEVPPPSGDLVVDGSLSKRPLEADRVPEAEQAQENTTETPPESLRREPTPPPAAADPAIPVQAAPDAFPLLPLPRASHFTPTEVLAPPGLPLRRFDQDALQALFMTDEVLDLPRISRLAAQLPGVHACVIATRDQACTGGNLPEGFDLAALLGLAPRVGEAAGRMPIGALKHFTLYGAHYSVSFFERNGLSLCAVHRPHSFVPGVREKLVAIADELSRS